MRMIKKNILKDGYQQNWFFNNVVNLHSEIEAV